MKHEDLAKQFVHGAISGTASHMFIEGNVIYSYGHHWPLAIRLSDCFIVNHDKYSMSTSRHRSRLMQELVGNVTIYLKSKDVLIKIIEKNPKTLSDLELELL